MPTFDYDCGACAQRFEVLVGGANQYEAPTSCPDCGSEEFKRAWTFQGFVSQTTFMDPIERGMHLHHKANTEKAYREGKLLDCQEKGPSEFRPKFPKKFH